MTWLKASLAMLAISTGCATTPSLAAEKWLKAETKHFTVYSAGSREQLERFALQLEKFDSVLRRLTGARADEQPLRLPIYVLAGAENVANLTSDKSRSIAGFYRTSKYGSFAVANRARGLDKFDLRGDVVLQHEYAHHFMFRNFAFAYPAWYVEGFAEFVATTDFLADGSWTVGKPPLYRAYGLVLGRDLPIERLLFGRTSGMPRDLTDIYYGRAWALVHMLRNDKSRVGQLDTYLASLGKGVPEREAAKAFGDLAALDEALDRYLREKRIAIVKGSAQLPYASDLSIRELDPVDSQLVMLGLQRRSGKDPEKTRAQLRSLADAHPSRANVWLELALAEQDRAEAADADKAKPERLAGLAAAGTAVDKALAADPKHGRANLLKAELIMASLDNAGNDDEREWKRARGHIAKANRADVLDPAPLFTWHESFVRQGLEPDKTASDGLALAFSLAPEATDLRIGYAFDLARQKRFDEAFKVVEFVVRDPHNAEQGNAVIEQLRTMRDRQTNDAPSD